MAISQQLAVLMSFRFVAITDSLLGRLAQLRIVPPEPQEAVRIEEKRHPIYSLKSSRCSSSSATIINFPFALPGRRGWRADHVAPSVWLLATRQNQERRT